MYKKKVIRFPHKEPRKRVQEEGEVMGKIIYLDEYRKRKQQEENEGMALLKEILDPKGEWNSVDEQLRYYAELADMDKLDESAL